VTQFGNTLSHREDNTTHVVLRVLYPLIRKLQEHFFKKIEIFFPLVLCARRRNIFSFCIRAPPRYNAASFIPHGCSLFSGHVYETAFP
jgi:hypothetical protein